MATKVTAPTVLSITKRMQYERFIGGTSNDRSIGFTTQVIATALEIDFSLDTMNGRLMPTHESRRQAVKDNRVSYATDKEWDALNKFLEGTPNGYGTRAEEVLFSYVTRNDLDGMDAQFNAKRAQSQVRERKEAAKVICDGVLADIRDAFTVDDAEAALTRLREYHVALRAESDTLKELIANS
jgi:hypothetical protein